MISGKILDRAKPYRIHILLWALFILYESSISFVLGGKFWTPVEYLNTYLINITLFYVNAHITLPYASKRPIYIVILLILLELIVCTTLRFCLSTTLFHFKIDPVDPSKDMYISFIKTVWRFIYFMGLSTGYWFALNTIAHRKEISDLERDQLLAKLDKQDLAKQLADSEIAYLKSQINPHFLFNTLNFLYNTALKTATELSKPILLLSDIMRYALTDTPQEGKVELDDEIEQVKTFIELNQFRFDNNLQLDFNISGDTDEVKILPLILLTPIENIFKYGDLKNADHPVKINLELHGNKLNFVTSNKKLKSKRHIASHGIGLKNLQLRLDAYYPNAHHIQITNSEDEYIFELQITL